MQIRFGSGKKRPFTTPCRLQALLGAVAAGLWRPSSALDEEKPLADAIPTSTAAPRLQSLGLRNGDRPLDLQPNFSATHYLYRVEADFSAASFAIDAIPAEGTKIVNAASLRTTNLVAPGEERRIDIDVANPEGSTMQYTITIRRLDGTDVKLRSLEVPGVELTPRFDADVTVYTAHLAASHENLAMRLVLLDAGQRLSTLMLPLGAKGPAPPGFQQDEGSASAAEAPEDDGGHVGGGASAGRSEDGVAGSQEGPAPTGGRDTFDPFAAADAHLTPRRRLATPGILPPSSGEAQRSVIKRRFHVSVGEQRWVLVRVRPANGDASIHKTYWLQAVRDVCPRHRPYFAPDLRTCSLTCNAGYFPDHQALRCEACPSSCIRCAAWDSCEVCEPSNWQALHFVQLHDGYCSRVRIPWRRALEAFGCGVILLSLCGRSCSSLCCGSRQRPRRVGVASRNGQGGIGSADESDGEGGVQSHRLLSAAREPADPGDHSGSS